MTVNHDVTGSSPVRGATKKPSLRTWLFLSDPKDWNIITAQSAVHIISSIGAGYHHAPGVYLLRIVLRCEQGSLELVTSA